MKKNLSLLALVVLLAGMGMFAYQLVNEDTETTLSKAQTDFAVADTASIEKIIITDTFGEKVVLKRKSTSKWTVNADFEARADLIEVVLKTIKRIRVKSPVSKETRQTIFKNLAGKHRKVQIFTNNSPIPFKTYYVGNPTQDHYGTYMLLETAKYGKSKDPYIMELPGFYGHLQSRFDPTLEEWRNTGVFRTPLQNIRNFTFKHNEDLANSFQINLTSANTYELLNHQAKSMKFDTLIAKSYLEQFKNLHFESFNKLLEEDEVDSIRASMPIFEISLTDNEGVTKKMEVFPKPNTNAQVDFEGKEVQYDRERLYAVIDGKDFVVIQYYVFDKVFKPISWFDPR
jgi:hypothetical protein